MTPVGWSGAASMPPGGQQDSCHSLYGHPNDITGPKKKLQTGFLTGDCKQVNTRGPHQSNHEMVGKLF